MYYPSISELGRHEPFELQVARGLILGHTSLNISGYQAAVGTTFIPIWENATAYVYPASASQMLISSSSASDTNVQILVQGLDANYASISETVILNNGLTGVQTVKSYLRINNIFVTDGVNPIGAISITDAGKAHTYAKIAVGCGRSSMTIYTVPLGFTFYLAKVNCYADQGNNQITNYRSYTINPSGIVNTVLQAPFASNYISQKTVPRGYSEKTDIQFQCNSSATSQVGLQVEGILIKNETP